MQARQIGVFDDTAEGWERVLYAFLAEKERRSGSRRTVEGSSRIIQGFFGRLGKPPDEVTSQDIFAWAHGKGAEDGVRHAAAGRRDMTVRSPRAEAADPSAPLARRSSSFGLRPPSPFVLYL